MRQGPVKYLKSVLFVLLLASWLSAPVFAAGTISPVLQGQMQQVAATERIPVIVQMQRLGRLSLPQNLDKHERRRLVVQSLVEESDLQKKELRRLLRQLRRSYKDLWIINGFAVELNPDEIRAFNAFPNVAGIDYDRPLKLAQINPQPSAAVSWNLEQINIDKVPGLSGAGLVVAILDSGVDVGHPEFLPGSWRGNAGDWFNPFAPNCLANPGTCTACDEELAQPCDATGGHGTGVMSLITGQTTGVAPGAQWIAAKIFKDDDTTTNSAIHTAFQWALNPDSNLATTDDIPDIVNGSWGFENVFDQCLDGADPSNYIADVQALRDAGVSVVFAGGNAGRSSAGATSVSPGNNTNNFATGYVDGQSVISPDSSRGPSPCDPIGEVFPELVAPGRLVPVAYAGTSFNATATGSSFATPHIAGVMALLREFDPSLTVDQIETALINSAGDLGDLGPDNVYGYGQVDVLAAVNRLSGQPNFYLHDDDEPNNDASVVFAASVPSAPEQTSTLTVENTGAGQLQISGVDVSAVKAPFSILQDSCDGSNLGANQTCSIVVRFRSNKAGSFTGSLVIQSNDANHSATTVVLSAESNTLPPAAQLVFPPDGAVGLGSTVTFQWAQQDDADGDALSHRLYVSEFASFQGTVPINVAWLYSAGGVFSLFCFAGLARNRRQRWLFLLAAGALLLLQVACGGGGGGSSIVSGDLISEEVTGLDSNTTYYWKVETLDSRGGSTESRVFDFKTR